MAILVLMTIGAAIGWLASILMRQDSLKQSLANIVIGSIGALTSFGFASDHFEIDTLSPQALVFGALGATIFLVITTLLKRRVIG